MPAFLSRRHLLATAVSAPAMAALPAEAAISAAASSLFTVSGNIKSRNRGAVDPDLDRLIAKHDVAFDRAFAFDRATLSKLGMREIRTGYPTWKRPHFFHGPLLRDVLRAVGAEGRIVVPTCVDGYQPEIPVEDATTWDVIVAIKADGYDLAMGGAGPAWIIYPRDDVPALHSQDDAKWAWGIVHMTVR